ncbi:MAG: hypothetical protein NTV68_15940 [Methanomicrobiales archaeon]|nr:hypothetical protein [Methanomicrobiales archaeon]
MLLRPTFSQFRDVKMATGYSSWLFIPGSAQFVNRNQKLFEAHLLFIQHNPQELQNFFISKEEESDFGICRLG